MRNAIITFLVLLYFKNALIAQSDSIKTNSVILNEIPIIFNRAGSDDPITFSSIKKSEIDLVNFGQDIPILLDKTIGVNSTSDAGNGIGYTYLRLRGSDQTRINVTLNGIPYNDPESHQVFWVNLPDFISNASEVQIQRGLGTSNNGAGAFGGTVNIATNSLNQKPYFETSTSYGSFNSCKNNMAAGTGLLKKHFIIDARYAQIFSDGYIDRASSKLHSFFMAFTFVNAKSNIRFIHFTGKEKTYQAWYGIPEDSLQTNRKFNSAGTDYGQLQPAYKNETDNYKQSHYQCLFEHKISKRMQMSGNAFYVRGAGYYEQYKVNQSFARYGFENVYTTSDTIFSADMIRRRSLQNHFFGANLAFNFKTDKLNWKMAAGANKYLGDHYGTVIWSPFSASIPRDNKYYFGTGNKTDINVYSSINLKMSQALKFFVDLQFRYLNYAIEGQDGSGLSVSESNQYSFLNPKIGLQAVLGTNHKINVYAGMGHHEPLRDDFVNKRNGKNPLPEIMLDIELNYTYSNKKIIAGINFYSMLYKNQLVSTGAINDVGALIRTNVDKSYRMGTELELSWKIQKHLSFNANATFSINKIISVNDVVNTYDENYISIDSLQIIRPLSNTTISFSPSILCYAELQYKPFKDFIISLTNKYTSRQFLDNTQQIKRSLKAYNINNLILSYTLHTRWIDDVAFSLQLNNITNRKFISNGYTYSERYAGNAYLTDVNTYNYYYPQAGFNLMVGLTIRIK
jgi:iron complex outermembrane receptor protein